MKVNMLRFDEENFLDLFVATSVINDKNPVINRKEMEKKLYNYTNELEYAFLFNNIDIDPSEKVVYLEEAFSYGASFGLVNYIDEKQEDVIINITEAEAKQNIKKYDKYQIKAMDNICNDYYKIKEEKKVMIK